MLDCAKNVQSVFKTGQFPRVSTRINMTTGKDSADINHFSYEDMGSPRLYTILFLLQGTLFVLMIRTFIRFYRVERKWMAPHPIMIYSLGA